MSTENELIARIVKISTEAAEYHADVASDSLAIERIAADVEKYVTELLREYDVREKS